MARRRNEILASLYGAEAAPEVARRLDHLVARFHPRTGPIAPFSARDAILITYGDQVQDEGCAPLQSLAAFCEASLGGVVSGLHLLPFHPYSSDDGFSVIDYGAVEPRLGSWEDIDRLGERFRLMLDAVVNHVSVQGRWFQGFLSDEPPCRDYFVTVAEGTDLSAVVRPRVHPVVTPFRTTSGERLVWTTFGEDQADLDYRNPDVLIEMVGVLLNYVAHGASLIRLDAIAYLWKEPGTACIHLDGAHRVVQLFRAVLDEVAPGTTLVTETNVAHAENISYFGDGTDEAHLVYNFALPILVLHAFHTGSARVLSAWASGLRTPTGETAFLNFLASHDGIGVNAGRGFIGEGEIEALRDRVVAHGGFVSERMRGDGSRSVYELNVNYFDALSDPAGAEPLSLQVRKFLTAHAIQFALAGIPAIYVHSLLGSRGWREGVEETGRARSINRQKLSRTVLEHELAASDGIRHAVFTGMKRLLEVRASSDCFDPHAAQEIWSPADGVMAIRRGGAEGSLCLHNVAPDAQWVHLGDAGGELRDLITGRTLRSREGGIEMGPFESLWIAHA